jgi:hypothetical protein
VVDVALSMGEKHTYLLVIHLSQLSGFSPDVLPIHFE